MNAGSALPDDLQRFVLVSVPSVPYLEAVLLLRADPAVERNVSELARALYVPDRVAGELLQAMADATVAQALPEGRYRYAPPPPLAAMLDRLAEAYARDLIAVTRLIHDRVQRNAQRFADAFKLRPDS